MGQFGQTPPASPRSCYHPRPGVPHHPERPTTPMRYPRTFDVIVVGGGHAGAEAALAAVRGVVTGTNVRILEASR